MHCKICVALLVSRSSTYRNFLAHSTHQIPPPPTHTENKKTSYTLPKKSNISSPLKKPQPLVLPKTFLYLPNEKTSSRFFFFKKKTILQMKNRFELVLKKRQLGLVKVSCSCVKKLKSFFRCFWSHVDDVNQLNDSENQNIIALLKNL